MAMAIYTSGGDCAGMNPAVKKFVDYARDLGEQPYLIYDGLEGMIDDNIHEASFERVSGILHRGGTVLRSSRSKRFFDISFREQAYNNLKKRNIDKLVVCGGDGSFRALDQFYQDFNVPFVGIPSTIDNDIYGTDYCLGVDTALNVCRDAIDSVRDTASSFRRAFVIECMGRDCGYLALVAAITSGAEVCIIPELDYNLESLGARLKEEIDQGRTYVLAIVAEGTGATTNIVNWLKDDVGMDTRVTILGHIQRGGSPTVHDRLMAFEFAAMAVNRLIQEPKSHHVVVYKKGNFEFITIDEVTSGKKELNPEHLKLAYKMVC